MEVIGIAINKVIVELIFLFILSTPGNYPMHIDMVKDDLYEYSIDIESVNDDFIITVSDEYYEFEIYAEWYDVFAYMIDIPGEGQYLIDLAYFFEIELTEWGFPEQTFYHDDGGEIYLKTDDENTVVVYVEEGITFIMDNDYFSEK
jgi:hypothetical protein